MTDWILLDSGETGWKQLTPSLERKLLWARVQNEHEIHNLVVPILHDRSNRALVSLMNEARFALSEKLAEYELELP